MTNGLFFVFFSIFWLLQFKIRLIMVIELNGVQFGLRPKLHETKFNYHLITSILKSQSASEWYLRAHEITFVSRLQANCSLSMCFFRSIVGRAPCFFVRSFAGKLQVARCSSKASMSNALHNNLRLLQVYHIVSMKHYFRGSLTPILIPNFTKKHAITSL